ncbi:MAG: serine/threonine protein kinase, partial [Myxococcota bacterium]
MGETHSDLAGLTRIRKLEDMAEIRAMWRRGIATLAAVASEHQPVPLEGFGSSELLAGTRMALSSGLFDELDWLSPPAAAVAIFELASALPRSEEKRQLGRRVLSILHRGDAETFVALATALALGSSRGLTGPQIRARLSLSMFLPVELSTRADGLALALISHRESEQQWLSGPSIGSLPERRLAARILERSARESARRAAVGDDAGLQAFRNPYVANAFDRLLADRESLVWRHVAIARGLLSEADPSHDKAIRAGLSTSNGPTQWRRAAAALAARIALAPDETVMRCRNVLSSEIIDRDKGILAVMISGLAAAGDAEVEAVEELLGEIIEVGELDAIEALAEVRRGRIGREFGARAAAHARSRLLERRNSGRVAEDALDALEDALFNELSPPERRMPASGSNLLGRLSLAHQAFADGGPAAARGVTEDALEAAITTAVKLERLSEDNPDERTEAFLALRELDHGLLETTVLRDLLTIRSQSDNALEPLARIYDQLSSWLLAGESESISSPSGEITHPLQRMRRLRALLHLVDADGVLGDDDRLRDRRKRTMRVMLTRFRDDDTTVLRRTTCATLARTSDALVREELCELSDIFIAATKNAAASSDLIVLGEA